MAKAKAKVTAKAKPKTAPQVKAKHPQESPIIQAGVIFIIVSAIGITAFVFATYYR